MHCVEWLACTSFIITTRSASPKMTMMAAKAINRPSNLPTFLARFFTWFQRTPSIRGRTHFSEVISILCLMNIPQRAYSLRLSDNIHRRSSAKPENSCSRFQVYSFTQQVNNQQVTSAGFFSPSWRWPSGTAVHRGVRAPHAAWCTRSSYLIMYRVRQNIVRQKECAGQNIFMKYLPRVPGGIRTSAVRLRGNPKSWHCQIDCQIGCQREMRFCGRLVTVCVSSWLTFVNYLRCDRLVHHDFGNNTLPPRPRKLGNTNKVSVS